MTNNDFYTFKLTGGRTPVSFQLPIKNQFYPKRGENGESLGRKKIHYIPGSNTIYVEDYKGDEKPQNVFFEEGSLKVRKDDPLLLEIINRHPWMNREFELIDKDRAAVAKINKNAAIKKALRRVDIQNEFEAKATALILIGPHAISMSENEIKAELEDLAFANPDKVNDDMVQKNWNGMYVAALSILRESLVINPSRTAVTWPDGKQVISVAQGRDPVEELGYFLNQDSDSARITLQTLGEAIKRSYNKNENATADEQISRLTNEEIQDDDVSLDDLDQLHLKYEAKFNKDVPNNMKNNVEWIQSKLDGE